MTQKIVILNELQVVTLKALSKQVIDGVLRRAVTDCYKQNVINALVRNGAIRPFHKNFKLNDVQIEKKPLPTPRAPKVASGSVDADNATIQSVTPARVAEMMITPTVQQLTA